MRALSILKYLTILLVLSSFPFSLSAQTRKNILLSETSGNQDFNSEGTTNYLIETNANGLFQVYIDSNVDVSFRQSTDGGVTWTAPTVLFTGSTTQVTVWYDRWSNIAADLIHVAYAESVTDDVLYRNIDAANSNTLSTETVAFAGASTGSNPAMSMTRARGGNIGIVYNIDGTTEQGYVESSDVGASWAAGASPTEGAADGYILLPGWAADNQDLMLFFWDRSADEISRKLYDDSGDSWSETSIATSMADILGGSGWPQFNAAVDISNTRNLLCAWSASDTANADLRVWHVTESTITEVTNVVTNSTDDQSLCAIGISGSTWFVAYGGKSDGSETWPTAINIYYKTSTDAGANWGSETLASLNTRSMTWLQTQPRYSSDWRIVLNHSNTNQRDVRIITTLPASGGGGIRLVGNGGLVAR